MVRFNLWHPQNKKLPPHIRIRFFSIVSPLRNEGLCIDSDCWRHTYCDAILIAFDVYKCNLYDCEFWAARITHKIDNIQNTRPTELSYVYWDHQGRASKSAQHSIYAMGPETPLVWSEAPPKVAICWTTDGKKRPEGNVKKKHQNVAYILQLYRKPRVIALRYTKYCWLALTYSSDATPGAREWT